MGQENANVWNVTESEDEDADVMDFEKADFWDGRSVMTPDSPKLPIGFIVWRDDHNVCGMKFSDGTFGIFDALKGYTANVTWRVFRYHMRGPDRSIYCWW